mmetsp:Transcript_27847/g.68841  ORF Transcript_27847/g.68841 Transcript_27847/m.68841 type:complete len:398 (+) Transcript_27847:1267-2460(+)
MHVCDTNHSCDGLRARIVHVVLAECRIPRVALQVEGTHDPACLVQVPHLRGCHAIHGHILENRVDSGPPRQRGPQHVPVRKHEALQQIEVVLAGVVADVDLTAAHGACHGVQPCGGVDALEHVPVGEGDLAHEEGVVDVGGHVHGVGWGIAGPEVVGGAGDAALFEGEEHVAWVAHAVDAVVLGSKVVKHRLLHRLHVRARGVGPAPQRVAHEGRHGLPIALNTVDACRSKVPMHPAVQPLGILRHRRVGDRRTHTHVVQRPALPLQLRLDPQQSVAEPREHAVALHARRTIADAPPTQVRLWGLGGGLGGDGVLRIRRLPPPVAEQVVPRVHELDAVLVLDLVDEGLELRDGVVLARLPSQSVEEAPGGLRGDQALGAWVVFGRPEHEGHLKQAVG